MKTMALAACIAWLGAIQQDATDRDKAWVQDLDELAKGLTEKHKNAFFKIKREDFLRAVEDVRKRIPELKDYQIAVELMKLAALIGDGHTSVSPGPGASLKLRRYPINPVWLKDGLFVAWVSEECKDLLKARIVAVGKVPVEEAARRVSVVAGADNDSGSKYASATWLVTPEVLAAVGLIDDMDKATFTVIDAQGKERNVELAPDSGRSRRLWGFDKEVPITRRWSRPGNGTELLADSKTLFAWYDMCADLPGRPVSSWIEDVLKRIDGDKPERLVFDLRCNAGGTSSLIRPLLNELRERPEAIAPGKLYVLIDRRTFSSGLLNALEFRRELKAILVGLSPGGGPNHYGEVRLFLLPNCKWNVWYSTKFFKNAADGVHTLTPDIEVDWTAAEFFSGADPALEAAIKHRK